MICTATYVFNEDGTFNHTNSDGGSEYNGRFSVSEDKIYLTDVSWFWHTVSGTPSEQRNRPDCIIEYEFGKYDNGIEYLRMHILSRNNDRAYYEITSGDRFERGE